MISDSERERERERKRETHSSRHMMPLVLCKYRVKMVDGGIEMKCRVQLSCTLVVYLPLSMMHMHVFMPTKPNPILPVLPCTCVYSRYRLVRGTWDWKKSAI